MYEMLGVDHPLTAKGVAEAAALREAVARAGEGEGGADAAEFLAAPVVLCSPLTRALQTTLVALHDHATASLCPCRRRR